MQKRYVVRFDVRGSVPQRPLSCWRLSTRVLIGNPPRRGVAQGLAERHSTGVRPPFPKRRPRRSAARWPEWIWSLAGAVGVYTAVRPLVGFGHQLAVAGLAWLAHAVGCE